MAGNVDISCIYEDPQEAYRRGLEAAGRRYEFLIREKTTTKKQFIDFIRQEIDAGRPLIAFGIIGPPEACILTGYRDEGEKLLGWNFFQNNPEFASSSEEDESGYFISGSWWESPETTALIAIGEYKPHKLDHKSILNNALAVLTTNNAGRYTGGPAAYKAWADALGDEEQISEGMPLPRLFERLMCQNDALTMVAEGRAYAAAYLNQVDNPELCIIYPMWKRILPCPEIVYNHSYETRNSSFSLKRFTHSLPHLPEDF